MKAIDSEEETLEEDLIETSPSSAVAKAFRLLDIIVRSPQPMSLNDLAAAAHLPKPSAHRMLQQLEDIGIVKRDVLGKRFGVGDDLGALAIDVIGALARTPTVRDIMQVLVKELGESCNLGILDGHDILYLERVECDRPLRMHLRAGSRVPIHCTAVGKLLLASFPEAKARKMLEGLTLKRYTPNTITDPDILLEKLSEIRRGGVSVNSEEFTTGLIGVAVPVTVRGTVVAGLAVHAPIFRMTVEQASEKAVPLLRRAADEIARTIAAG